MKGNSIVVPKELRKEIKELIHTGHIGINKMKGRARDCVYWPQMNAELVRTHIIKCESLCIQLRLSVRQQQKVLILPTISFF